MALVFGLGIGLFILIILWTLVIATGLLTVQWQNGTTITAGAVFLALTVTVILILIPRGELHLFLYVL